ncbi:MAG: hypothetical protein SGPRY_007328 [Prymnesium sp.]
MGSAPSASLVPRPPPPQPLERKESSMSCRSSSALSASGQSTPAILEMTMAQKVRISQLSPLLLLVETAGVVHASQVARIKEELSLETSLPIAKAIAEANTVMGIKPQGPLAKQVESLLTELGVIG